MDGTCFEQHKENSVSQHTRKRKQMQKGIDRLDVTIDKLPDEMLTAIVSCLSLKDAVRTSVLSRRWRYLWMFTSGTLEFLNRNVATRARVEMEKFKAWVHHVMKLHQGPRVDSLIIRFGFEGTAIGKGDTSDFNKWVYFFMNKEVKRFELNLSSSRGYHCCYKFPNIENLLLRKVNKSCLVSLRSLKLVDVDIDDDVVQYFLASCPYIEYLCVSTSDATKNLEIVDLLPYLKELEISNCWSIKSLEISCTNLVSFRYQGREIIPPFKRAPNLSELTLGKEYCESFIYEPNKHLSYSVQLVKLVLNLRSGNFRRHERNVVPHDLPQLYALKRLELNTVSQVGRSLLFFTSLIKAPPHLQEFKIEVVYLVPRLWYTVSMVRAVMPFPEVTSVEASEFYHENLKVVEMVGYCGSAREEQFLVQLSKIAPSIEMVVINTDCDYYCTPLSLAMYRPRREDGKQPMTEEEKKKGMTMTSFDAKKHADKLTSRFPSQTKFVIT